MADKFIQIHPKDNLLAALQDLKKGEEIQFRQYQFIIQEPIPAKHKFPVFDLEVGEEMYMYGVLIGKATKRILAGSRVSVDNTVHAAHDYSDEQEYYHWNPPDIRSFQNRFFNGYHRSDGRVGTRNYWLVIPLVFCENRNIDVLRASLLSSLGYPDLNDHSLDISGLKEAFQQDIKDEEHLRKIPLKRKSTKQTTRLFPNVDGIKFLTHEGGCGGTRLDAETLCRILAGYITHPNVGGATVLSLGCQHAQAKILEQSIRNIDPDFSKPLHILEQHQSKNEQEFLETAIRKTFMGLIIANKNQRALAPISKLTLGLECGASDGFSGISANPALGYTSDLLVALGGITILSEFPELNGVEQELINRCQTRQEASKFAKIMQTYSNRAIADGTGFENNPSPGNIREGLITDAIKSAGAALKGGTSPITDVLEYAEIAKNPGLNLLCTPGNDVESTTGLAGSGANIIVFTTGLGTPTGNPITPVIKMSSNTKLAENMQDMIDLDAGTIISGQDSIQSKGEELLELIIRVASGEIETKAMDLGQDDFIPWKRGVSL